MGNVQNLGAIRVQLDTVKDGVQSGKRGYAYLLNEPIADRVSFGAKKKTGNVLTTLLKIATGFGLGVATLALIKKSRATKVKTFVNVIKSKLFKKSFDNKAIKDAFNTKKGKEFVDGFISKFKGAKKVDISKLLDKGKFTTNKFADKVDKSLVMSKAKARMLEKETIRRARISEFQKFVKEHRIGKNNIKSAQESAKAMMDAWAKSKK